MRTKDEEKFRRIIGVIQRHSAEFGNSPSIREIVAETGISRGTVQRYLAELKEQGRLDYSGHRNIRMAGQRDAMRVPLVGRIACGQPILAEENIEETYTISPALAKSGSYFLLRAEGDSMIDAGIDSGDLVLVRQQETAETGQIVVAFIDDEDAATLKRYYPEPEKKRVRLKPENLNYEDIRHAKEYMDMLSKGVDPISRKEVGPASIVSEPRLQKCFAFVSNILEELLANDGYVALPYDGPDAPPNASAPQYELVRKKDPFRLSQEQRRSVYIAKGPVTPNTFVNHVNRVIDGASMEKLSIKSIHAWLLKNEYIAQTKQPTVITKTVMKPMMKAAKIGIEETETTDPKTGEIKYRIMLTPQAQQFLLDNLDRILEES